MIDPLSPDPCDSPNVHVFGARGHRWKRIRFLTSSALKTSNLKKFLPIIKEQTDDFIEFLKQKIKKEIDLNNNKNYEGIKVDSHRLLQKLTASVIGRSALGLERIPFEEETEHFKCFNEAFGSEPRICLLDSESLQWLIPTFAKIVNYFSPLWDTVETPISKLNNFINFNLKSKIKGSEKIDFLQKFKNIENSNFLNFQKSKNEDNGYQDISKMKIQKVMGTDEIISQIRFLSIAGFDTTANTLSFVLLLLAENEEKMKILLEEIENFSEDFNYEELSELKYLHCVILETLRLFPHASMLQSRLCMEDCPLPSGKVIPKGVGVLFDTWAMHRDLDYWGHDGENFVPERYLSMTSFPDYFTPFGVGQRQCVGMRFALLEQKIILVKFLKEFRVSLPEGMTSKKIQISLRDTGTVWPENLQLFFHQKKIV